MRDNIFILQFFCFTIVLLFFAKCGDNTGNDKIEIVKVSGQNLYRTHHFIKSPAVKYNINARLYPEKSRLKASESLTWINKSIKPISELRFHLYYNAFRNEKSTFLREAGYYKKSSKELKDYDFSDITISKMIIGGEELTEKISYISPDDGNRDDRTVLMVKLNRPVLPGRSIKIFIDFTLKIPEILSRTGQEDNYFFMAQWFPKIGVLEKNGKWHCHQFHANSEFLSDFGEYNVKITLPEKFLIGATGILIKKSKNSDGTVSYTFHEHDIHDFAWTAYPYFRRAVEKIRLKGNKHTTTIELLYPAKQPESRKRIMNSVKFAMIFFAEHIFPYPYEKLTIVQPPLKGIYSGGMEYPTLITAGYYADASPDNLKFLELVTIHEFIHQYFYGMIASDEFREAWLDEGVTTFFEMEIVERYFKDKASYAGFGPLRIDEWESRRKRYVKIPHVDKTNTVSWGFVSRSAYGGNVYSRAAFFLRSLTNYAGRVNMYPFFRYYANRYKFKHPGTDDFIREFNKFMKTDFNWAFEQYINGTSGLDNSVYYVESVKVDSNPDKFRNEVVFIRNEGFFPVETLIKLQNGKEIRGLWKENKKWRRIVFHDKSPIVYAAVDPDFKLPLDYNFLNNVKVREFNKSGIKKFYSSLGLSFQAIISFLIF